jgi:hypothetical protein
MLLNIITIVLTAGALIYSAWKKALWSTLALTAMIVAVFALLYLFEGGISGNRHTFGNCLIFGVKFACRAISLAVLMLGAGWVLRRLTPRKNPETTS